MILFDFEPNWNCEPKVTYSFLTVIAKAKLMTEQRKALLPAIKRSESFTVDIAVNAARVQNVLQAGNSVPFYLPIFTEALIPTATGNLNALTTITVQSFSSYYNLNNLTTYLMLIDLTRTEISEIVTVGSLVNPDLNLTTGVVGTFPAKTTVIYPIMFAACNNKQITDITDKVISYDLNFTEFY